MSPFAFLVGLECMANLVTTRRPCSDRSSTHARAKKSPPDTAAKQYPPTVRSRHADDRDDAATNAVAVAFARIVAERYPGTSWLPIKPSRSDNGLVVPAGKVLRLLPGPADMDTSGWIGHSAAPAARERAPHEHGSNAGA
jgi:hypothetical protein